jgi:hypothetical protein
VAIPPPFVESTEYHREQVAPDEVGSAGAIPLAPTKVYAAPRSALAIHSGSRIRGVEPGGSSPLVPTRKTSF